MPVKRYRSVEDMPDDEWLEPGSPELFAAIRSVWDFSARTCPYRPPPGVYRNRSIHEAQARRDAWEQADFEALWAKAKSADDRSI